MYGALLSVMCAQKALGHTRKELQWKKAYKDSFLGPKSYNPQKYRIRRKEKAEVTETTF